MQFIYHKNAGETQLTLDIQTYAHVFKVRRVGMGEVLQWRNLEDTFIYDYEIIGMGKKEAILALVGKSEKCVMHPFSFHVGWSIIDPKIIEKTLPMLNELGVEKLSLVYADFSQKQYKVDEERMERILINSSQQCGRSKMMEIEIQKSVKIYFEHYPSSAILDFCDKRFDAKTPISSILVGPEGGFSQKEREFLKNKDSFGLACPAILRSETAVVAIASKILI